MEPTLSITDAQFIYKSCDKAGREKLESIYGRSALVMDIKEKIKSFEDACALKGNKPEDELSFENPKNNRQRLRNVNDKLDTIADGLNEGFVADFANPKQKKWFPVFKWDVGKSAFVFSGSYYGYGTTDSSVGVRRHFENSETSDYFGKQFIDLHNEELTL